MQKQHIFIQGPAFSAGQPQPLEYFLESGVLTRSSYEDCCDRNVTAICVDNRPLSQTCAAAITQTLRSAGLHAKEVDCVIVVLSTPTRPGCQEEYDLIDLHRIGLHCKVVTLDIHDCTAVSVGVKVAIEHIQRDAMKNILLLLVGHTPTGMNRHSSQLGTIFGDGAATCIISAARSGFEVAAVGTYGNPNIPSAAKSKDGYGEQLLQSFEKLRELVRLTLEQANSAPDAVRAVFGTHGGQIYFELMAEAADLSYEKVYSRAMQGYGHIYSCDNIIALADFLNHHGPCDDRVFCLIGWGPRGAGVVILREVGAMQTSDLN
jgi:3-oxoacyl-[acyl-carrier-protein] synthase III